MQNRFKSKVLWTSVFSLILLIMNSLGLFDKLGITSDTGKIIIDSVLSILVLFGILNSPTNTNEF